MTTRRSFLSRSTVALAATGLSRAVPGLAQADSPDVAPFLTPYKYEKLILEKSADSTSFDSRSVDCPFVFHHNGAFYMTYVGYDGVGYQTGLATSADLVTWKRLGCILRRDPASEITRFNIALMWILRENQLSSTGNLIPVDGQFLGAWHAYPNPGYEAGPAVIGLARSRDLMHWQLEAPILRPDDADAAPWEQGGLYKPCLVRDRELYYLFYNAKTRPDPALHGGWHEQIGVATSRDLRRWVRYSGNPILRNGIAGSWDDRFASDPCVLRHGSQWAIYYYGLSSAHGKARDLLALTSDPYHPHKVDRIMVDAGPPGSVDDDFAHKPSLITRDGMLYHFYCAVSGRYPNDVRGISVARSRPW